MRRARVFIGGLLLFSWLSQAEASDFDHSLLDRILNAYVDPQGLVDYNGIAQDARFARYVQSLNTADLQKLPSDAQLAFWINAYNVVMIDKVLKKKPKESVLETFIPKLWISTRIFKTREHEVVGREVSLEDIEHGILRKQFKEPRIHFAIVCASMGCPPLSRIAYTEQNVQALLHEQTLKYIQSPRGSRIDREKNRLYLSNIFSWFEEDFVEKAGSVDSFISSYLDEEGLSFLKERKPQIEFLDYDWSLNAKEPIR